MDRDTIRDTAMYKGYNKDKRDERQSVYQIDRHVEYFEDSEIYSITLHTLPSGFRSLHTTYYSLNIPFLDLIFRSSLWRTYKYFSLPRHLSHDISPTTSLPRHLSHDISPTTSIFFSFPLQTDFLSSISPLLPVHWIAAAWIETC